MGRSAGGLGPNSAIVNEPARPDVSPALVVVATPREAQRVIINDTSSRASFLLMIDRLIIIRNQQVSAIEHQLQLELHQTGTANPAALQALHVQRRGSDELTSLRQMLALRELSADQRAQAMRLILAGLAGTENAFLAAATIGA